MALRLRRARAIDPLHRIEEGSDPGAGAVQGLDDGVLFGAYVLVLVADHHWIAARQHVGDERTTLKQARRPAAVAVIVGQGARDETRFRISLGDLADQAVDGPDFQPGQALRAIAEYIAGGMGVRQDTKAPCA